MKIFLRHQSCPGLVYAAFARLPLSLLLLLGMGASGQQTSSQQPTPQAVPNQPSMPAMPSMRSMPGMPGMDRNGLQVPSMRQELQAGPNGPNQENGRLQEPEDPNRHTGSDTPVPDYMRAVDRRAPMTLQDFENLAQQRNPTLRQAEALARLSAGQARQASLFPNPSAGYQGEQIRGGDYGGGEQGAFVQQTIPLGGKLGLRGAIYRQQQTANRIGVEEQRLRVQGGIQQAFYRALAAQAEVDLRARLVGLATDAAITSHQLANVGQADAPDILQSEVEAEQAKLDYARAQRVFFQSFQRLASLAGQPALPVTRLQGNLSADPGIATSSIVATLLRQSPQVQRADQQVRVAEAQVRSARREVVPDLTIRAGEQYNGEQVSLNPVKAVGAQSFLTAGITLPLWNRNQGNIQAAKAALDQAQAEAARIRLSLQQAAQPTLQQYLLAQLEVERYRTQLLPRAERAYQLYLGKYTQMASAYPQVLVSQRIYFQLQVDYMHSLAELWSAATALQYDMLSGGLQAPDSSGSSSTQINLPTAGAGGGD